MYCARCSRKLRIVREQIGLFKMENSHDYYVIYDEGYGSDRIRATVYYTGEDM